MKKIFLHIGMPKTASTAIQTTIRANRGYLDELGYSYPVSLFEYDNTQRLFCYSFIHQRFPGLVNIDFFRIPNFIIRSSYKIKMYLSSKQKFIFSNERLASNFSIVDVRSLRECFGNFDVQIILYLRRQDKYCEALYRESLRSFNFISRGILDFRERFIPQDYLDYNKLLDDWTFEFGKQNITVIPYVESPGIIEWDAVDVFFEKIGLNKNQRKNLVRQSDNTSSNSSLQVKYLTYLEIMKQNKWLEQPRITLQRSVEFLSFSDKKDHMRFEGDIFTTTQRHDLLRRMQASNNLLKKNHLKIDLTSKWNAKQNSVKANIIDLDERTITQITLDIVRINSQVATKTHFRFSIRSLKMFVYQCIWPTRSKIPTL